MYAKAMYDCDLLQNCWFNVVSIFVLNRDEDIYQYYSILHINLVANQSNSNFLHTSFLPQEILYC